MDDIEIIAFMLFLEGWLSEDHSLSDIDYDSLIRYKNKWINEWKPELTGIHCGDCTNIPMACTRCHVEYYFEKAKKISEILKS